jgi:hypothetical protein
LHKQQFERTKCLDEVRCGAASLFQKINHERADIFAIGKLRAFTDMARFVTTLLGKTSCVNPALLCDFTQPRVRKLVSTGSKLSPILTRFTQNQNKYEFIRQLILWPKINPFSSQKAAERVDMIFPELVLPELGIEGFNSKTGEQEKRRTGKQENLKPRGD